MRETVQFEIPKKTLKYRRDNFVLYDVDFLLDNLSMEVYLLENYRQHKDEHAKLKIFADFCTQNLARKAHVAHK